MVPLPDLTPFPDTGSPRMGRAVISGAAVTRHPTVLGAAARDHGAGRALPPPGGAGKGLPAPRPAVPVAASPPFPRRAARVRVCVRLPLCRTPVLRVGPRLRQDLILVIVCAKTYFQIRSCSEVLGVGTATWGDRAPADRPHAPAWLLGARPGREGACQARGFPSETPSALRPQAPRRHQ